ncbi:MAG: hypothetical protein QM667_02965 [Asticcacaulis sp.]
MKKTLSIFLLFFFTNPAHALDWRTKNLSDPFTDVSVCRVEFGGDFSRAVALGFQGGIRGLYFIAEKRGDEIRAGFMSDPPLPIPGDIQVRVDQNQLHTITAADTPLDLSPSMNIPNLENLPQDKKLIIEQSIKNSMSLASPYRLFSGEKASALLNEIISGKKVIWRAVTVNAAASLTGEIRVKGLQSALNKCGIL